MLAIVEGGKELLGLDEASPARPVSVTITISFIVAAAKVARRWWRGVMAGKVIQLSWLRPLGPERPCPHPTTCKQHSSTNGRLRRELRQAVVEHCHLCLTRTLCPLHLLRCHRLCHRRLLPLHLQLLLEPRARMPYRLPTAGTSALQSFGRVGHSSPR